jgi:allantoinase
MRGGGGRRHDDFDMPLNSIPSTTSVEAQRRRKVPDVVAELNPLIVALLDRIVDAVGLHRRVVEVEAGGVPRRHVETQDLREAFPILAQLGLPLMVHAEDPAHIVPAPPGGSHSYATYVASHPPEAERAAIEMIISLMDWCPAPVHIVHLSSASSLGVIRAARARGRDHRRNVSALF